MSRFAADHLRTVAVLGAGTMGHGIAHVCAQLGCSVALYDIELSFASRGLEKIAANLAKGVELGKLSPDLRDATLARLRATASLEDACAGADLVVEAAPEKIEIKRSLFERVDRAAPAALLATNTSSLSIASIASSVTDPSRVVGMHFFNPVHLMKLVEVVRHPAADASAVEAARSFSERLGKTPIVVSDSPGFASSRLGLVLG
ncbi:MAG TPA: 3-hydroxyacyl-CoA dehydrogenase NAD-binding domain-containing protein, partial [Kofleriaceae bacterium]|nr:3-hydroxyacyl-CoA dehydrogenase NAD-binding domain-containing protein [Kofleriaceae bacterium]